MEIKIENRFFSSVDAIALKLFLFPNVQLFLNVKAIRKIK